MANEDESTISDWDPLFYDKYAQPQFTMATNLLKKYTFKGNEIVLDIGSGTGYITKKIAELVPLGEVLGIDISPSMIDFSSETYRSCRNLSFELGNIVDYTISKKFDLITTFSTLHWVYEQQKALKNIGLLLKEGGKFISTFSASRGRDPMLMSILWASKQEKWRQYIPSEKNIPFISTYSMQHYTKKLKACGLEVDTFNYIKHKFLFESHESLANWIQSWSRIGHFLPSHEKKEFFLNVVQRYCLKTNQQPNSLYYNHMTWDIIATKVENLIPKTHPNAPV